MDNHDSVNNSCKPSDDVVIWSNQSNIQPHLEKSLFKARAEDSTLKNSQAILSKKPVNGILGKKYAQNDNIFKSKHTPAK